VEGVSTIPVALSWDSGIQITVEVSPPQEDIIMGHETIGGSQVVPTPREDDTLRDHQTIDQVTIDLIVGRTELPLSQVLGLTPGRVLVLAKDLNPPIELVVGGRIIGHGELVTVEGRLGVRIERLQV
jgi:flagellar motor switch/type III secretory pathway protein FliN